MARLMAGNAMCFRPSNEKRDKSIPNNSVVDPRPEDGNNLKDTENIRIKISACQKFGIE
jgi:hypothetical protein